jgi:hypothetical protein
MNNMDEDDESNQNSSSKSGSLTSSMGGNNLNTLCNNVKSISISSHRSTQLIKVDAIDLNNNEEAD